MGRKQPPLGGAYGEIAVGEDATLAHALDANAWAAVVDEHLPALWHALLDEGVAEHLANEACQIAWLQLAIRIDDVPDESRTGWLLTTARIEVARAAAREAVRSTSEGRSSP